jgi:hypothetical protein
MKAIELLTVWQPNWTLTNRGTIPSGARSNHAQPKKSAIVTMGLLLVLTLAGPAPALTWDIETVDSEGDVGWWTSIALDSSDNPQISYFDRINTNLKYTRKLLPRFWATATVDSAGRVGEMSSLALDPSGYPHITYMNFIGEGNRDLKYARRLPSGAWSIETVDAPGDVGYFPSIAVDSDGRPHIAYYDFFNGYLKYARKLPSGGWSIETADSDSGGNVGGYTSIALDSAGNPHISYYDWVNGNLKYARKMCTRIVLRDGSGVTYCSWSNVTVDAGNVIGGFTSIALDSSGLAHIGYTVSDGGNTGVRYARRQTSGSWILATVESGSIGSQISMVLDASGLPHFSYPDTGNRTVKYARKLATGGWSSETVDTGSTGHNSIALDSSGNPHISYYDSLNGNLRYAKGHPILSNWP